MIKTLLVTGLLLLVGFIAVWYYRRGDAEIKRPVSGPRDILPGNDNSSNPELFTGDERLLQHRIILLEGMIDDDPAAIVIAKLLYLESDDSLSPIELHINSTGGKVANGLAIVDVIAGIRPPVHTVCRGEAHGMAAVILASGRKGHRQASRQARISITTVEGAANRSSWSQAEREKYEEEFKRMMNQLVEQVVIVTGQTESVVRTDFEQGRIFTPGQAKEYNLIDEVVDLAPLPE